MGCEAGTAECKCSEEIVFDVSEGLSPDDASRKFLVVKTDCGHTLVACYLFLHRLHGDSCPLPFL
jgi:predicted methyltransferase